jgi:hypothetical protein
MAPQSIDPAAMLQPSSSSEPEAKLGAVLVMVKTEPPPAVASGQS